MIPLLIFLQSDSGKYQDSDNPLSDSDSDGEGDSYDHKEKTERYVYVEMIDCSKGSISTMDTPYT